MFSIWVLYFFSTVLVSLSRDLSPCSRVHHEVEGKVLATTVQCMIQSGKWALSATWASRANVIDEIRAEALWASMMAPHQVTP